jgi:eukaryotic-like serine/threonine-protein kinase
MGVVYLAEHRLMERQVAIKVINKSLVENPEALERFHREVRAAARLNHENIVRAYDAEQAGDLPLLVMEYVEGLNLAQVLERRGVLLVAESCHYTRQAAIALQHAFEKGMVHRDLKPQNLMLIPETGVVKVLDFGLARLASERQRADRTENDHGHT